MQMPPCSNHKWRPPIKPQALVATQPHMTYDDPYDDEDWYDDDDELDDEEPGRCPECGTAVHSISDKCPACGYWLSAADRHSMWSGFDKPHWIKVTAAVVLITILVSLVAAGVAFF